MKRFKPCLETSGLDHQDSTGGTKDISRISNGGYPGTDSGTPGPAIGPMTPKALTAGPPIGYVDSIRNRTIRGWFLPPGDPQGKDRREEDVHVTLFVSGEEPILAKTDIDRPDVDVRFGRGHRCGFEVDLSEIASDGIVELKLVHEASSFNLRGRSWQYCHGVSDNADALRAIVYPEWYKASYGLEHLTNAEAIANYMHLGVYEGRDPCPWFSCSWFAERYPHLMTGGVPAIVRYLELESSLEVEASRIFDPRAYLARNSDLDGNMGLLRHFVARGRFEGRPCNIHKVPEHVAAELVDLAELEPALVTAKAGLARVVRYPRNTGSLFLPGTAVSRFGSDIDVVVCVPWISLGGADLIATYLLRAYQKRHGNDHVLLIVTDKGSVEVPEWLSSETLVLCLDAETTFTNKSEKVDSLHEVIGRLAPSRIVNANSSVCWDMYRKYGEQLATALDLYAYLFCFDEDKDGSKVGYISDYIPDVMGSLSGVFCDNSTIIERIRKIYGFPDDTMAKFHTVYVPAPQASRDRSKVPAGESGSKVLWIGRLARQKRPELLIEVANKMPDQQFVVYGPVGNAAACASIVGGDHENIEYRGVYSDLSELDLGEFVCLLNTSAWEGLPTLLIQMASFGLPIVTSDTGGITELINQRTGWVVPSDAAAQEYVSKICNVIMCPDAAARKTEEALHAIEERHTWDAFTNSLSSADVSFGKVQHVNRNAHLTNQDIRLMIGDVTTSGMKDSYVADSN